MKKIKYTQEYNTPYQLKLPLEIEKIIEISDPVYTFCEVLNHIDLQKYLAVEESRIGRPRYDSETLLKVILFAFMEQGYVSTRGIEKLCKTDVRFMYLLNDRTAPSHMTIDNFMKETLSESIENIFKEINGYIFECKNVDTEHIYIDGTKLPANANKYSWVWKKSSIKSRDKTFLKISELLEEMNLTLLTHSVKIEIREEYAIEYVEQMLAQYAKIMCLKPEMVARGRGHHKTTEQRYYDKLSEYCEKLKKYAEHIRICGDGRNSYSKTDNDATFMRMKRDYMGNDQLLPGYNIQLGICDEYIAVFDVKQYASDTDCFIPLMERFRKIYGHYPRISIGDAGYGSLNNYIFCEEHNIGKYMKFAMYEKTLTDENYRTDPFRAINFPINESGNPVCPNGKEFHFVKSGHIRGNKYGRTEEYYQCEDCSGCSMKPQCCKCEGNRGIRLNSELSCYHQEVIDNLNSIQGALLRMNRSIQAEGAFGSIKWNRAYTRARRRGLKALILEIGMISCGFNLHKYYLKKMQEEIAA